jgi:hypothetical protein
LLSAFVGAACGICAYLAITKVAARALGRARPSLLLGIALLAAPYAALSALAFFHPEGLLAAAIAMASSLIAAALGQYLLERKKNT